MKKLFLVSLSLLLIASFVWATETRVLTLGNANHYVKDDYNIFIFPSAINSYKSMVVGEVDPNGFYRFGVHYDVGEENGVIGMYFDQTEYALEGFMPNVDGNGIVEERLNLFYGRPLMDYLIGLNLTINRESKLVDGNPNDKSEESNTGIGIRLGMSMVENLDLSLSYMTKSFVNKDNAGDDITKPESNMEIDLMAGYRYQLNDEVWLVPHALFGIGSMGYSIPNGNKETWSSTTFDLGCGVNINPDENILLLFDFGFYREGITHKTEPPAGSSVEEKESELRLPYFRAGLEGNVTKWWDVRFGVERFWQGMSDEHPVGTDTETIKEGQTETTTYIGSGFTFGNLAIDIQLDPQFILRGPNFVSGQQGDIAQRASVKYTW